ncbi:MAG: type II toxin-antitoxin system prevent-host-death family antitoxin [Pseudomonadota bacterium]
MNTFKIHEAKTNLSKLIARVEAGEEIVIARGDKPVATLQPVRRTQVEKRKPGVFSHLRGAVSPNIFLEPTDDAELAAWEGSTDSSSN